VEDSFPRKIGEKIRVYVNLPGDHFQDFPAVTFSSGRCYTCNVTNWLGIMIRKQFQSGKRFEDLPSMVVGSVFDLHPT
jgi:hypothetical protein